MPRLLVDGTALTTEPKGVGHYSYHLIDQLSRRLSRNWSIYILTFGTEIPQFSDIKILKFIHLPKLSDFVKGLLAIPLLTLYTRADVVLLPMEATAVTLGRPTLAVLHDINELIAAAGQQHLSLGRQVLEYLRGRCRLPMLRNAQLVICNSEFTFREASKRYAIPHDRLLIGYCGVDERFYCDDGAHVGDWCNVVRNWNGYVLTFATGDPRERYDLCPAVWQHVRPALPKIGLIIGGVRFAGNYVVELRGDFAKRGLIEGRDYVLLPFLDERGFAKLRALYREADFYLELSAHEGFGMQLVEAMATGTTCISSGRGALKEVGGGYTIDVDELEPSRIAATIIQSYQEELHLRDNKLQIQQTKKFAWDAVGALVAQKLSFFEKNYS